MNKCVFCQIVAGQLPSQTVYQDELVKAFLDIRPVQPGHLVVITKAHYPQLQDVPDERLGAIFAKVKWLRGRLQQALGASFVLVSIVGVDVPHFHVQLIPRRPDDDLAGWPTQSYKPGEAEAMTKQIKAAL